MNNDKGNVCTQYCVHRYLHSITRMSAKRIILLSIICNLTHHSHRPWRGDIAKIVSSPSLWHTKVIIKRCVHKLHIIVYFSGCRKRNKVWIYFHSSKLTRFVVKTHATWSAITIPDLQAMGWQCAEYVSTNYTPFGISHIHLSNFKQWILSTALVICQLFICIILLRWSCY